MTGPGHFAEAERLLAEAVAEPGSGELVKYFMAAAQVHATLALAAATALYDNGVQVGGDREREAWLKTAGTVTP